MYPIPSHDPLSCPRIWPRAIILIDMNAFFASVEQLDYPEWRARPLAVTNGRQGTCIITCSYEARAYGIHTGMRLNQARKLCPDLIQAPSRPKRYAQTSTAIMDALTDISPDMEIYSVDEAFLDVTHCQTLHGTPARMGRMVKQRVFEASGLHCSVGVSGDKTTAKYAAKCNKPNGLTIIPPWEAKERLSHVAVTDLWGIAKGTGRFLQQYGVYICGDMEKLPISVLARRFGNPGRRIWYKTQGMDPDKVQCTVPSPQSVGHGKVMPPDTTDVRTVRLYLSHMATKVVARLRKYQLYASRFMMGLRTRSGWIGDVLHSSTPTNDERPLQQFIRHFVSNIWHGEPIWAVQVTALDPHPSTQLDLFAPIDQRRNRSNHAIDEINQRYGELTLASARLLDRSSMPNVIAPSWKPRGHRQTI